MFNHQPANYVCPFCRFIAGEEDIYAVKGDVAYENDIVMAKVSPKWWASNPGSVLVIPKMHYENMYDISQEVLAETYITVRKIALAIRSTYNCQGVSTRQHNEPAANQNVWHFHVHVFPRYEDDKLYQNHDKKAFVDAETRAPYARKLRDFLASNHA